MKEAGGGRAEYVPAMSVGAVHAMCLRGTFPATTCHLHRRLLPDPFRRTERLSLTRARQVLLWVQQCQSRNAQLVG